MLLHEQIKSRQEKISIIGLGYVGLPLAMAFAKVAEVVGYDTNIHKVARYNQGIDVTKEVGNEAMRATTAILTTDELALRECKFHIVAVPTPVKQNKVPDLSPLIGATETVGRNLAEGSIVVYESTVYPGVTEDICVPILERESGLQCGIHFKVGYSPERINPGDKEHRLENIVKVVSAMDEESLENIAKVYELIVEAGVFRAPGIKVAEAAKVIENAQRDINIAFMNELSIIFSRLGIDTKDVLDAARTKWNFLDFRPGLVGGHCIGVDPYYLTYRAEEIGYHSQVILSGRRINDSMGKYVAEAVVKQLIRAGKPIQGANALFLGITFKENCPDSRNTKVVDIIRELEDYGVNISVVDPVADPDEVWQEHGIRLSSMQDAKGADVVIVSVPHREFLKMTLFDMKSLYRATLVSHSLEDEVAATAEVGVCPYLLIDVKGMFNKQEAEALCFSYWRL